MPTTNNNSGKVAVTWVQPGNPKSVYYIDPAKIARNPEGFMHDFDGGTMQMYRDGKATTVRVRDYAKLSQQGYTFAAPAAVKPAKRSVFKQEPPSVGKQISQATQKATVAQAKKNLSSKDLDTVEHSAEYLENNPQLVSSSDVDEAKATKLGVQRERRMQQVGAELAKGVDIDSILKSGQESANKAFLTEQAQRRKLDPLGFAGDPLAGIVGGAQKAQKELDPDKLTSDVLRAASSGWKGIVDQNMDRFKRGAAAEGMNLDDYIKSVWQHYLDASASRLYETLIQNEIPKDRAQWYVDQLKQSFIGNLTSAAVTTQKQKQVIGEARARNQMGEGYQAGWVDKGLGMAAQLAADTPLMMGGGAVANGVLRGMGLMSRAAIAGNTIRVANATLRGRIFTGLGTATLNSSMNLAIYDVASTFGNNLATDTHMTFSEYMGQAGHGAVAGAALGAFGKLYNNVFSPIMKGVTGVETSFMQRAIAHGRRGIYHTGGLLTEGAALHVGNALTDPDNPEAWTWGGYVKDVTMAAFFKLTPQHAAKVISKGVEFARAPGKTWGKKSDALLAQLSPEARKEIDAARGDTKFFDYIDQILKASDRLATEKSKSIGTGQTEPTEMMQSLQNEYNRLTSELSWDTQNALNTVLFGSPAMSRPRMQYIAKRDGKLYEVSKDGETLSVYKPTDAADEASWRKMKKNQRRQLDSQTAFWAASQKVLSKILTMDTKSEAFRNLVSNFMAQHSEYGTDGTTIRRTMRRITDGRTEEGQAFMNWYLDNSEFYQRLDAAGLTTADIDKVLKKNPGELTRDDVRTMNLLQQISREIAFPKGEVHTEQAAADGANAAEAAGMGTENPNVELVRQISERLDQAQQRLDDFIKSDEAGSLYAEYVKTMTPWEAYVKLRGEDGFTEEQLAPIAEFLNADAAQRGFGERTEAAIDENASEWYENVKYNDSNGGEHAGSVVYVTDEAGHVYYVKGGAFEIKTKGGEQEIEVGEAGVMLMDGNGEPRFSDGGDISLLEINDMDSAIEGKKHQLQTISIGAMAYGGGRAEGQGAKPEQAGQGEKPAGEKPEGEEPAPVEPKPAEKGGEEPEKPAGEGGEKPVEPAGERPAGDGKPAEVKPKELEPKEEGAEEKPVEPVEAGEKPETKPEQLTPKGEGEGKPEEEKGGEAEPRPAEKGEKPEGPEKPAEPEEGEKPKEPVEEPKEEAEEKPEDGEKPKTAREEYPLTKEQIMADEKSTDDMKDAAIDYLEGEDSLFGEAIYKQIAMRLKGKEEGAGQQPMSEEKVKDKYPSLSDEEKKEREVFDRQIKAQQEKQGEIKGKVPKQPDIQAFVPQNKSDQQTRPVMTGVYHDPDGYGVVTDGQVLYYDKALYDESNSGKTISTGVDKNRPEGEEIEGKYPNWKSVIPKPESIKGSYSIDAQDILEFASGIENKLKKEYKEDKSKKKESMNERRKTTYVAIGLPDGKYVMLSLPQLKRLGFLMQRLGSDTVDLWGQSREGIGSFHVKSDRGGALVLGLNTEMENCGYFYEAKSPRGGRASDVKPSSPNPIETAERIAKERAQEKIDAMGPNIAQAEAKQAEAEASQKRKAELKQAILDKLKGFKNQGKGEAVVSFLGMNNTQMETIMDVIGLSAQLGFEYIKDGVKDFERFAKKLAEDIGDVLRETTGWGEKDMTDFYKEVWAFKVKDEKGERKKLSEWASLTPDPSPKGEGSGMPDAASKRAEERTKQENDFVVAVMDAHKKGDKLDLRSLRKMAKEKGLVLAGEEKDGKKDGITDSDLQELAELAYVQNARRVMEEKGHTREAYDEIVSQYERQATVSKRDSDKIEKQQYSTPTPLSAIMALFGNVGRKIRSVLEPSAGNGALVFGFDNTKTDVNDIDPQRLSNLRRQGFRNVTSQDGTKPFREKAYDMVVTNPPFSKPGEKIPPKTVKVGDRVYTLTSLDHQMAANALDSMKDDGRAAIIVGGHTKYDEFGVLNGKDLEFLSYLYDGYNVVDIINIDGNLYKKNGTGYAVRMILIDGRRKDVKEQRYAPVKEEARAEEVKSWDELYKRHEENTKRLKERKDDDLRDDDRERDGHGDAVPGREGDARPVAGAGDAAAGDSEGTGGGRPGVSDGAAGILPERGRDGLGAEGKPGEGGKPSGTAGERPGGTGGGDLRSGGKTAGGDTPRPGAAEPGADAGGGRDLGGEGRPEQGGGGRPAQPDAQPAPGEPAKPALGLEKVPYAPRSGGNSLGTLTPASTVADVRRALEKIGDVDKYVMTHLGYANKNVLYEALGADQIDAVAMAIYQMEQGSGFIIGDGTGVGKGRQAAVLMRYAIRKGKTPIFVTQKPDLFSDIYRDFLDTDSKDYFKPFIINTSATEVNIKDDNSGDVLFKGMAKASDIDAVLEEYRRTGKLPNGANCVLVTYSQLQAGTHEYVNGQKRVKRKKDGKQFSQNELKGEKRREFFSLLARDNFVIMDESHTAAGATSGYFMDALRDTKGVTFLSGTFAKRPDSMPLYGMKTAISSAGRNMEELIAAVARGGVTLQEIMSQNLSKVGQMIRRERPMDGAVTQWINDENPESVERELKASDAITDIVSGMCRFQRDFIEPFLDKKRAGIRHAMGHIRNGRNKNMGISTMSFTSQTYNIVRQMSFALKADFIVEQALKALREGRKPIIAVSNTMESFLNDLPMNEDMPLPDFSESMIRKLNGLLYYEEGKVGRSAGIRREINLEELGEDAVKAYRELERKIDEASTGLSLSPIDYITHKIEEAGYAVGELTGRKNKLQRNDDGTVRMVSRTKKDTNKKDIVRRFNNNDQKGGVIQKEPIIGKKKKKEKAVDVIILNKSSATGISLHSNAKFGDTRQREMILGQLESDINDAIQMLGRVNRTGQVEPPLYTNITSNLPAEQRLLMMYKNKVKSLFANTTGDQKSSDNEVEVVDMLNKYGDQVCFKYLVEHPEVCGMMMDPLGWGIVGTETAEELMSKEDVTRAMERLDDMDESGAVASRVLSRLALLPVEEQKRVSGEIEEAFNAKMQILNETGENTLVATELPLKAKTKSSHVVIGGADPTGGNPFAADAVAETVEVDVLVKPMRSSEVQKAIDTMHDKSHDEWLSETTKAIDEKRDAQVEKSNASYDKAGETAYNRAKKSAIRELKNQVKDGRGDWSDEQIEQAGERAGVAAREQALANKAKKAKDISRQWDEMKNYLEHFKPGMGVSIPDKQDESPGDKYRPGIFIGFKEGKTLTPAATMAIFATADGRRKWSVQLNNIRELDRIIQATNVYAENCRAIKLGPNWDKFNEGTGTREERTIITGNILAYLMADEQRLGQIIRYTTEDGEVKTGVLLPKGAEAASRRLMTEAEGDLRERGDSIVSSDGNVVISHLGSDWRGEQFRIQVPSSRKEGGMLYLDHELTGMMDYGVFQQRGSYMVGSFSRKDLHRVLERLDTLGVSAKTKSDKGGGVRMHLVGDGAPAERGRGQMSGVSQTRKNLRDFVVRVMQRAGVKVSTDWEEGQRVLASTDKGIKMQRELREKQSEDANKRFNEELQMQIDGTLPENHVYEMGKPGEILLSTGIADIPIQMKASLLKDKSSSFGHDYELSEVKDLVSAMNAPVAVFSYGEKGKAQNIIVEIQKDGKNFVVGLAIRPLVQGRVLEVNSIRNVFPKDNAEWLNWISQDKMLYVNKEKIQTLIDQQRTILADVDYLNLDDVANKIKIFQNPKYSEENLSDSAEKSENSTKLFRTPKGDAYGFVHNGKIYIDPEIAGADTPIHEYTHLWAEAVRQSDPKAWERIVKLMKGQKELWDEVTRQYSDLKTDDEIADEVLAHYSGSRGESRLLEMFSGKQGLVERAKEAIGEFWRKVCGLFGVKYTSAAHVADTALKDLLVGVNPNDAKPAELGGLGGDGDGRDPYNPLETARRIARERREASERDHERREIGMSGKTFEELRHGTPAERSVLFSLKPTQYGDLTGEQQRVIYESALRRNTGSASWKEAFFDQLHALKNLQKALTGKSKKVLDAHNVYDKMVAMTSVIATQQFNLLHHHVEPCMDVLKSYVKTAMKDAGMKRKDAYQYVKEYIYTMSGLERNRILKIRDFVEEQRGFHPEGYDDLSARAQEIYKKKEDAVEWDALTPEEEKKERARILRESHEEWVEEMQNDWYEIVKDARKGTFNDYLDELDDFIKEFDDTYDPTEKKNDRSGVNQLVGGFDDKGHFDEQELRDNVEDAFSVLDPKSEYALWDRINDINQQTNDKQFESGLIDRGYKKHLDRMMAFYVPMRRWAEDTAEDVWDYRHNDFSNKDGGRIVMRAKGRKSMADDPLATMLQLANRAITLGEQNKVKNTMLRLVNATYDPADKKRLVSKSDTWLVKIGVDGKGKPIWDLSEPNIKDGMTPDEVADEVERWEDEMRQKKLAGEAKIAKSRLDVPYRFARGGNKNQHAIRLWANGKQVTLWINGDPRAAQAINGALAPSAGNVIDKTWGKAMRGLSAMYTSYSPTFAVRNIIRDISFGMWNVYSKEGWRYSRKVRRQWFKNFGRFAFGGGQFGGYFKLYEEGKLDTKKKYQKYFKEFMDNGGKTGYVHEKHIREYKEQLENAIKNSNRSAAMKFARKWTLGVMEHLNDRSENLLRFAVYVASREGTKTLRGKVKKPGKGILESIADAKDVSVNFNKKGAGFKSYVEGDNNSLAAGATAELIRQMYVFSNPAMQSIAILGRNFNFKEDKARATRATVGAFAHVIMGAMWPAIIRYALKNFYHEDEDDYANLMEYERRSSLCIPLGKGRWAKLPFGIENAAAWAMGHMFAERFLSGNEDLQNNLHPALDFASTLTALSPVDPLSSDGKSIVVSLSPTIIAPMVQAYTNTKWTGAPVEMGEERWTKGLPKYTRAYKSTPAWLVGMCRFLNDFTNGDGSDAEPGFLNFSPGQMDVLIQGYLGGPGKTVKDITNVATGDGGSMKKWPVLNGVLTESSDEGEAIRISNAYRHEKEKIEEAKNQINYYKKHEDDGKNPSYTSSRIALEEKWGDKIEALKEAEKAMKEDKDSYYNPTSKEEEQGAGMSMTEVKRQFLIEIGRYKDKKDKED